MAPPRNFVVTSVDKSVLELQVKSNINCKATSTTTKSLLNAKQQQRQQKRQWLSESDSTHSPNSTTGIY